MDGKSGRDRDTDKPYQGHGNYVEDRQQWQQQYLVDAILLEMKVAYQIAQ